MRTARALPEPGPGGRYPSPPSEKGRGRPTTRRALIGAAAGLAPCLAACEVGGGAAPATKARGPAKVAFWNYGGGGVSDQLFDAVAQEYRKQFPQITLERTGIP